MCVNVQNTVTIPIVSPQRMWAEIECGQQIRQRFNAYKSAAHQMWTKDIY